MREKEAAREAIPLFADTHADRSAIRDRVQSWILGDAMKLWVQVQRGVVAYKWTKYHDYTKLPPTRCWCSGRRGARKPLKRATERDSDNTVKTTTALRASQFEETV